MIVCGVDIKGKEAILAIVESTDDESNHVACESKKITLSNDKDVKDLKSLQSSIEAFARANKIEAFVIKSRQATGQMAAGGITFKIETLFQISGTPVVFVSPPTLATFAKSNRGGVPRGVLAYQSDAYRAGAWHLAQV